ncbi:MAG: ketoacyl-ACP synthase III [Puniceicoccales bacterium]|jgi:3-oxoacyl-[acyl-carrier-protein] synthase-3|nr:ketoacyl-ACP synthase III [Puniceicoccales bacterium]
MAKRIFIRTIGSYLPERVLTNGDLEKIVSTSDEWIVTRTGIRERHIAADGQTTSDMAAEAARAALATGEMNIVDIDAIIVATVVPDMPFPSTACFLQQKLGARNCPCIGIEVGCSGIIYMAEIAAGFLERGQHSAILAVAADKLSAVTDWTDRSTCVILADGAAAMVFSGEESGAIAEFLGSYISADGSGAEHLCMPGGGCRNPATEKTVTDRLHYLKMNGREVFKRAVRDMATAVQKVLERFAIDSSSIAHFIPHQANMRIIEAVAEFLNVPVERFVTVLDHTGNTSSASLGIAMDEASRAGRFKKGDLVMPVSFGAGLTSGAALLRWLK